jgi:hypothetical protein
MRLHYTNFVGDGFALWPYTNTKRRLTVLEDQQGRKKGKSAGPEAILKQGNEIYLFGAIFDSQVVGSNSLFMTRIIDN